MQTNRKVKRALLIGNDLIISMLIEAIARNPECGYAVASVVSSANFTAPKIGLAQQSGNGALHASIMHSKPDVVIVPTSHHYVGLSDHQILEAKICRDMPVESAEEVYETITGKIPIESFAVQGIACSSNYKPPRVSLLLCRGFSFLVTLVGLVVLFPLMLVIAMLIKLDSSGPVLFVQERLGMGGKTFKLLKFRTMRTALKRTSEWEKDNLHRITRVGKYLRKFRLDELPQFFNIIAGDMNVVGPRPHPVSNFKLLVLVARNMPISGVQIPFYSLRSSVRPGITGWAQVRYCYANTLDEEIEKLRFDLYYIKHYSFWLDLQIMFETFSVVFKGHLKQRLNVLNEQEAQVNSEPHKMKVTVSGARVHTSSSHIQSTSAGVRNRTQRSNSRLS